MQKDLNEVKTFQKVSGGGLIFLKHCRPSLAEVVVREL